MWKANATQNSMHLFFLIDIVLFDTFWMSNKRRFEISTINENQSCD